MFGRNDPCKKLKLEEKGGIISLYLEGKDPKEIATAFDCNVKTVRHWIERWEVTGTVDRKTGSGRKRITTRAQDRQILAASIGKPISFARDVKRNFFVAIYFPVSLLFSLF